MRFGIFTTVVVIMMTLAACTHARAQTITFSGVPSNTTVQCLSEVPGGLHTVFGPIPFGIASQLVNGKSAGDTFIITDAEIGSGKAGKLDLGNYSNNGEWSAHMTIFGCNCTVTVGPILVIPGNSQVKQSFESIGIGAVFIMPVVDDFSFSGNTGIGIIVGFVVVQLIEFGGTGSNWYALMEILSAPPFLPTVTATGSCGSANVIFHETRSDPTNNCNQITRTWTATDSCSNSATANQTIVVNDITPPSIACPPPVTVNVGAGQCAATNVYLGLPTASDNCYGRPTVGNNAPSVFSKGTNLVAWTTSDSCGNSATCTQQVIVVDNQLPIMSCPGNNLTNAADTTGTAVTFTTAATDNCDGSLGVNCVPASGSMFGVGTTPVNCAAVDSAGNPAGCTFNVTVVDPTIFCVTSIVAQGDDVLLNWVMPQGWTGVVQAANGDVDGGYSNSFGDINPPIFVPGTGLVTTNYLDMGAATNSPSRYYRVRLVP